MKVFIKDLGNLFALLILFINLSSSITYISILLNLIFSFGLFELITFSILNSFLVLIF